MMAQIKKDYVALHIKMDAELMKKLQKFCEETGLSKTAATEKILDRFFAEYFSKPRIDRDLFGAK